MLSKDEKSNWSEHLNTLVFTYNAPLIKLLSINPTN